MFWCLFLIGLFLERLLDNIAVVVLIMIVLNGCLLRVANKDTG